MVKIQKPTFVLGIGCVLGLILGNALAATAEWNPVTHHTIEIGPQASRLIVGFKATSNNAVVKMLQRRSQAVPVIVTQAQTSMADVQSLAQRAGIAVTRSRQITPSMHVVFLPKTLYGADVNAALQKLRADPSVRFAAVDQRRYPHSVPNDPDFAPNPGTASGQWYMNTPNPSVMVEGVATMDLSATDAVSAWNITTGSTGIVIADVDTGVIFNHPDLLRAGFGGRLLPGYDFVGQDLNPSNSSPLGTFDIANDGDGWDPDPTDPGDWISNADIANPNKLFATDTAASSSWHGTRVVGVFGAIANNSTGIAGMTWGPWILPVRALGKGGGYDSDILAGVEWAAGLPITNVPDNPYPADIINLSLGGGTDACSGSAYEGELTTVTTTGALVVISAGNGGMPGQTAPVELPANCAAVVPGVLAVAGLRNVGTKVGYSSFGPEVSIAAPAGNCVITTGVCLRSIDTTTNLGTMGPGTNSYTNETNPNLGTSFSAPIVSGIAGLMRSVNYNLTPAQLVTRIKASASPFPGGAVGVPTCPANDPTSGECVCPNSGGSQCGVGMVNALSAVTAALNPIVAVAIPAGFTTGSATLDASGSEAACGATIASYSWSNPTGTVQIVSGANAAQVNVMTSGSGQGSLTLTVTDSAGKMDSTTLSFTSGGVFSTAPSSAKTAASACPEPMNVMPLAPVVTEAFAPATVAPNAASTLTITLTNNNGFDLTQSGLTQSLPANLSVQTMPAPATTCNGTAGSLTTTTGSVTLANAIIPAMSSCTITLSVMSTMVGTYTNMIADNALSTGPAGGNTASATASLDVATAGAGGGGSSGKSGGGVLDIWDLMLVGGVLLAGRRRIRPRP
jgi:serine protease